MDSMADVFLNQNYREFAKLLSYAQARSNAVYDYIKEPSKIFPNQRKTVKRYILFQYMTDLLRSKKSIINSAEFGIYRGVTSLMMEAFFGQFEKSQHYAFDSFEGLSTPQTIDKRPEVKGIMSPDMEKSKKLLKRTILHKGWIPQDLPKDFDTNLDFIHIDLDLHDPVKGALDFVHPLLNPGAILLIDDYVSTWPGAMKAVNQYIESNQNSFTSIINHCNGLISLRKKGGTL